MSTNITIFATRDILVIKTNKLEVQAIRFECICQTSTAETKQIMQAPDKIQAYKNWIMSREWALDREELVYAEDDIFHEETPIGKKIVNDGIDHIKRLDDWLDMCAEQGYDVFVDAW